MRIPLRLLVISILFSCGSKRSNPSASVELANPTNPGASLPHLVVGEDRILYLSWVEPLDTNTTGFYYSKLNEAEWTKPELIAAGTDWFVNWADYPMLAVDQEGNKIAHYLEKSTAGTYSYDVKLVLQSAKAATWSNSIVPHRDGTPTEHGFVTLLPNNDGTFLVSWLDGRHTGGGHEHTHKGSMTLRAATLDLNRIISQEVELDASTCDCCQTGGVNTDSGPMVVYRDRSIDEIRDISFVQRVDSTWTPPRTVASDLWQIDGCPVNGPSIASYKEAVAAAWFTSAMNRPAVKVAFMMDSTFADAIELDTSEPFGRVDIALINSNEAVVSWLDSGEDPAIKYRQIHRNGKLSVEHTVAVTSAERGSGFPQMAYLDGFLYFAWTHVGVRTSEILLKKVPIRPENP